MNKWYNLSWNKVVDILNSDSKRGLSFKYLEINLKKGGKNNLNFKNKSNKSKFKLISEEFSFFIFLIIIILVSLKAYVEAIIVFIELVTRTYFFYKEKKVKLEQLEAINKLNYTDVWVMRGGIRDFIKAEDLVIGDIVLLKKGNIVPADIRIIEADGLKINERNILGEDYTSIKNSSKIDGDISSLKELYNMAFRGTRIVDGEGKGIVVSIGTSTRLGSIVKYFGLLNEKSKISNDKISKFKNKINIFGTIFNIMLFIVLRTFEFNRTEYIVSLNMFIIAIYNLLDFSNFLVLKYKIRNFEKVGIKNLKLDSLGNFGNLDIIFIDKIGAITEEKFNVKALYTNMLINESGKINMKDINEDRLLSISIVCNNSKYDKKTDTYMGDLMEGATLKFSSENGMFKSSIDAKNKRIFEVVNHGHKNIKTTVNKTNKNYRAHVRGDLDAILESSEYIMIDGIEKPLSDEMIEDIKKVDFNFQNTGYVTEAFAYRSFKYEPTEDENIESNLVFVGIMAYENQKKPMVLEMVREVKRRDMLPILFTDDNKVTAYRIGKESGLVNNISEVISGIELLSLNKDEMIDVLSRVKVFCRLNPEIRNKIVEIFVENKYNVCSTGENLSHIPTVLLSNISIARGRNAVALIKTLSTVSLEDDILKNIIYIYDEVKAHKYNLDKSLEFVKKIMIVSTAIIVVFGILFKINFKIYVIVGTILGILGGFSISLLGYSKIEKKIYRLNEFISNKWKLLKLR